MSLPPPSPLASEQGAFSFYHVIFTLELLKVICQGSSVALLMSQLSLGLASDKSGEIC